MLSAASWVTQGKFKPTSCDLYYKVRAGNTTQGCGWGHTGKGERRGILSPSKVIKCFYVSEWEIFSLAEDTGSSSCSQRCRVPVPSQKGWSVTKYLAPGSRNPPWISLFHLHELKFLKILKNCWVLGTSAKCTMPQPSQGSAGKGYRSLRSSGKQAGALSTSSTPGLRLQALTKPMPHHFSTFQISLGTFH